MKKIKDDKGRYAKTGYKGFDCGMICRGKQYVPGTITVDGRPEDLKVCYQGMHFCTDRLSVFQFYPPGNPFNVYAEVAPLGTVVEDASMHKACTDKLYVDKPLTVREFCAPLRSAAKGCDDSYTVESSIRERSYEVTTGRRCANVASGYSSYTLCTGSSSVAAVIGRYSRAEAAGHYSVAAATDDRSTACTCDIGSVAAATGLASFASVGVDSVAVSTTQRSCLRGGKGSLLVFGVPVAGHIRYYTCKVDGRKVKADTWYMLRLNRLRPQLVEIKYKNEKQQKG